MPLITTLLSRIYGKLFSGGGMSYASVRPRTLENPFFVNDVLNFKVRVTGLPIQSLELMNTEVSVFNQDKVKIFSE